MKNTMLIMLVCISFSMHLSLYGSCSGSNNADDEVRRRYIRMCVATQADIAQLHTDIQNCTDAQERKKLQNRLNRLQDDLKSLWEDLRYQ